MCTRLNLLPSLELFLRWERSTILNPIFFVNRGAGAHKLHHATLFCQRYLAFSVQYYQHLLYLPFPHYIRSPTPSFSHHFKTQRSSQHFIIIPVENTPIPSHTSSPGKSIQNIFQNQQTYKLLAPFLNQSNFTHCSYHCFFNFSQNCHLILLQTPCLASIQ